MYPANTAKVVWGGVYPQGEIWETSFAVTLALGPTNQAGADSMADLIAGVFNSTIDTGLRQLVPSAGNMNTLKVYFYNGGSSAAFVSVPSPPSLTGTGGATLPLQACVVVTLLTGAAGRSNRGRMYLPAAGAGVSMANNQLNETIVDTITDQITDLFDGINALEGFTSVAVVSQTHSAARPVTSIRVDSKVDIQRRRANKQAPLFTATAAISS